MEKLLPKIYLIIWRLLLNHKKNTSNIMFLHTCVLLRYIGGIIDLIIYLPSGKFNVTEW